MAFLYRPDTKIYDPFSNYIDEQSTLRSKFTATGIVTSNPIIAQNVTKGDAFKIPNNRTCKVLYRFLVKVCR